MTRLHSTQTNFTGGELSAHLLGRSDLAAFQNGASLLQNVIVHPTGGVSRRAGLRHVETLPGAPGDGARLIAFTFNTEQAYLLALTDQLMHVFRDGVKIHDFAVPWTRDQIPAICWTQSADTLLITHPDVAPRKITRTGHTAWTVSDWTFFTDDNDVVHQPYHKFADEDVTLAPSATSGAITLTASANVFDAAHVNRRLRIGNKEVLVTAVASATSASATTRETLGSASATKDWEEEAFSPLRGWPRAVTFHQDRLVIGGTRDLPNRLWMSKSSDLFNFDLGEGLDDEAIEFSILADSVNAIRAVFSGRHLQVFTTAAEWMVSGDPLTPVSIQLKRQTRIGSIASRYVPPRDIDGATQFCGANGQELRAFLFTDVEQSYGSADLTLLARHMVLDPEDMDFDGTSRLLYIVRADGKLATLANYRSEKVTAWSMIITEGIFRAIAVVDDITWVLVERNGALRVEHFDDALGMDGALSGSDVTAKTTWSGLDHLNGQTVRVLGDGADMGTLTVTGGVVEVPYAVKSIQAGLEYNHIIAPLPPTASGSGINGPKKLARLIHVAFRLKDTAGLRLDTGRGPRDVPFKKIGTSGILDTPPPTFTGDVGVRALGWNRNGNKPLWQVEGTSPMPLTILSVTTEMKVAD